jgi:hypothetical protein
MEAVAHLVSRIKNDRLTLLAGLSLLIPPVIGVLHGIFFAPNESTSLVYPIPGLVLLPMFFIGPLAMLVPMVFFFIWNPGLFNGDARIPKRSYVLLVVATLLSPLWFVVCWKDGAIVQGLGYNFSLVGINAVWIAILWFIVARSWKAVPSFRVNLLFHWLLFAWLAWCAFPFFGEFI